MEEKLYLRNRGDGDYFLESRTNNSASVVGSLNPTHFAEHKLSLKNCEAIERGYDLDELAEDWVFGENSHKWSSNDDTAGDNYASFKSGFQKALSILGDKKYSERDMRIAYNDGMDNIDSVGDYIDRPDEDFNDTIQSLQQTEWEVEIEMDMTWVGQCNCPCHSNEVTIMHFMACCHPKMVESPKSDSDGCLILKRK